MIKLIPVILIWFSFSVAIAQDSLTYIQKRQFISNQTATLTPTQIIENFKKIETIDPWISKGYPDSPNPFESAFYLNIVDYFSLNEIYDSPLKKEVFKQTSEYKTLMDSLKKIKTTFLNSMYYETGFNSIEGENFTADNVNYDLQKKGFEIAIGIVLPYQCDPAFLPKVIEQVEFKQLQIIKRYHLMQSEHSYKQYLFIPMNSSNALEIESNRENIEILRVFEIKGIYTASFNDYDFLKENHKTCYVKIVNGGNLRLLIYNKKTDKVYFDKLFPTQ
jgi:hypothetical protein